VVVTEIKSHGKEDVVPEMKMVLTDMKIVVTEMKRVVIEMKRVVTEIVVVTESKK
jgi:hypothetical protein